MPQYRIVMISPQFMPEVFGGAEQQCLRLSKVLARRGHKIHILTSRTQAQTAPSDIEDGVEIVRLKAGAPPQQGGRAIVASLAWMRRVYGWIESRRAEIDVLHMHQAKVNAVIGAICGRRFDIPTIVKVGNAGRGMDLRTLERKRPLYGKLGAHLAARDIGCYVAISSCIERELAEFGVARNKITFIPNGIDLSASKVGQSQNALREAWGLRSGDKAFLFAGRLEKQKNVAFLIDAFARLAASNAQAVLVLLGDGEDRAQMEARAHASGQGARIKFLGKRDDVRQSMAAADFFVLPALTEGLSNALLEAMSVGLVPISSRVSGSLDAIVPGENGWLFDVGDGDGFVQAMQDALEMPGPQLQDMRAACMARAARDYDMEAIADQYEILYEQMRHHSNVLGVKRSFQETAHGGQAYGS